MASTYFDLMNVIPYFTLQPISGFVLDKKFWWNTSLQNFSYTTLCWNTKDAFSVIHFMLGSTLISSPWSKSIFQEELFIKHKPQNLEKCLHKDIVLFHQSEFTYHRDLIYVQKVVIQGKVILYLERGFKKCFDFSLWWNNL